MKNTTIITLTIIFALVSLLACFVVTIMAQPMSSDNGAYQFGTKLGQGIWGGLLTWGVLGATAFSVVAAWVVVRETFFKRS
jgi:hypothetical protein